MVAFVEFEKDDDGAAHKELEKVLAVLRPKARPREHEARHVGDRFGFGQCGRGRAASYGPVPVPHPRLSSRATIAR